MVIHVFLIIENTLSWAVSIQNSSPNKKTGSIPTPLNLSTESVSKFVDTYSLDILNSNRFRRNERFAQEIGSINFKNIFAYRSPYERF
jgi:hypothetical protein